MTSRSSFEIPPLLRKHYYLFKALNLSALPDRNDRLGRTGHSRHAILRALIIKHLERTKSVPPLLEMCGFDLGNLPDQSQFYRFLKNTKNSSLKNLHHKLIINSGKPSLPSVILQKSFMVIGFSPDSPEY